MSALTGSIRRGARRPKSNRIWRCKKWLAGVVLTLSHKTGVTRHKVWELVQSADGLQHVMPAWQYRSKSWLRCRTSVALLNLHGRIDPEAMEHIETRRCWCMPEHRRVCSECDHADPNCWQCHGDGAYTVEGEWLEGDLVLHNGRCDT